VDLHENTTSEIEKMHQDNKIMPPIDPKRYWTTVAVLASTAIATIVITNWALPSKVDTLAEDIKEMRKEQATKADVENALEDSREYTDRKVKTLESDLKLSIERMLANQEHIKTDIREGKTERKEITKSVDEIRSDVSRVKFAVETQ